MSKSLIDFVTPKEITTTVDIVVRLQVVGEQADVEPCRRALEHLADVMAAQAADGLWSQGHHDAGSEPIANVTSTHARAVLIGEARCERLGEIARELAAIASHAVHVPGKTTAMDDRVAALVRELDELETP